MSLTLDSLLTYYLIVLQRSSVDDIDLNSPIYFVLSDFKQIGRY